MHQHVAPIVHVGKGMARRRPAQVGIQTTQLTRRVGPQTGKHHIPVHRQGAVPLGNQRLRVGRHVQRHIGPEHLHTAVGRQGELGLRAGPAGRLPPGLCQGCTCDLGPGRVGLGDKTSGIGKTLRQQPMGLQPAPHRVPMGPGGRFQRDPLQTVFHATRHLFVQPGRQRRCGLLPAGSSHRVNRGRKVVGHKNWPRVY